MERGEVLDWPGLGQVGSRGGGKGGWKRTSWNGGGVRLEDGVSLFVQEKVGEIEKKVKK